MGVQLLFLFASATLLCQSVVYGQTLLPFPSLRPIAVESIFASAEQAYLVQMVQLDLFVQRATEFVLSPEGALVGSAVRSNAQRERSDHLFGWLNDVTRLANSLGISLVNGVTSRQQSALTAMDNAPLSGVQGIYLDSMILEHQSMIALSNETASNEAVNKDVRGFAEFYLVRLQAHLRALLFVRRFPNGLDVPIIGPIVVSPGLRGTAAEVHADLEDFNPPPSYDDDDDYNEVSYDEEGGYDEGEDYDPDADDVPDEEYQEEV